jgi:predicted NodU family carbamoyl transferase
MSAVIDNNATTQSTKVKTPSLPEKYSKFIQFGYYMMTKMMGNNDTSSFTKDEFLNKIQMFATVEEQQTFIQGFFDNQKENKKDMRKMLQERKKANQPKKKRTTKKTTQKETSDIQTETTTEQVAETQEDLLTTITNELTEEPMIDRITTAIEVAKDITAKKPRAKKTTPKKLTKKLEKEWEQLLALTPPVYDGNPSSTATRIANILTAKSNGENVDHLIIELLAEKKEETTKTSSQSLNA